MGMDLGADVYSNTRAYIVNAMQQDGEFRVLPFELAGQIFPAANYPTMGFTPGCINVVARSDASSTLYQRIASGAAQLLIPADLPDDLVAKIRASPIIMIPLSHAVKQVLK